MVIQSSLLIFQNSLKSKNSVKVYTYLLQKFMKYYKISDYDSVVNVEKKELQTMVEDYVMDLKNKISPNSISTFLNPIKTFLKSNDIDLNWLKIKRLYPVMVKRSGSSAYSTDDVKKMLEVTTKIRKTLGLQENNEIWLFSLPAFFIPYTSSLNTN